MACQSIPQRGEYSNCNVPHDFQYHFYIDTSAIHRRTDKVGYYNSQRKEKARKREESEDPNYKFAFIDERILKTPSIALMMLRKELVAMAHLSKENFDIAFECLKTLNFDKQKEFEDREKR